MVKTCLYFVTDGDLSNIKSKCFPYKLKPRQQTTLHINLSMINISYQIKLLNRMLSIILNIFCMSYENISF